MRLPVVGLVVRSEWTNRHGDQQTDERHVELLTGEGAEDPAVGVPVRVSSWSIESDWLYVVFNGHRRAYRLLPNDIEIEEVYGESPRKPMFPVT